MPKYNDFELDIQEGQSELLIADVEMYSNWTCHNNYTDCICETQ